MSFNIPPEAVGIRLYCFDPPGSENIIPCEAVRFVKGAPAVDTILRRAAISGRVELEGKVEDHMADILDEEQTILATVALDAKSYSALKDHWMPCRIDRDLYR